MHFFLLFYYSHLSIRAIHCGKRRTLTWVVNLVQQLDGASGHHAAQAHDKAGWEGTHGEERKLLHTHTKNAQNAQFSHGELHTVQHTNLNEQKDRQVDKVSAIYTPTPTLCVGGGGAGGGGVLGEQQ